MQGKRVNLSPLTRSLIVCPILFICFIILTWGYWFILSFWILSGIAGMWILKLYETKIFLREIWTFKKYLCVGLDAVTFGVIFFFVPLDIYGVYFGKIKIS